MSQIRVPDPCEEYAAVQKHGKYDVSFEGKDFDFCPVVWETLGAVNAEGEDMLRQIFRFAAKELGREFSSFCGSHFLQSLRNAHCFSLHDQFFLMWIVPSLYFFTKPPSKGQSFELNARLDKWWGS